jgi:hypothetical protein
VIGDVEGDVGRVAIAQPLDGLLGAGGAVTQREHCEGEHVQTTSTSPEVTGQQVAT